MKASLLSITGLLLPLVASTPLLNVDIHVTEDAVVGNSPVTSHNVQHLLSGTPDKAQVAMFEQIPGWIFFEGDVFRARIHGNTFWNVKGKLTEAFPLDDFLFDPLLFTLNHPEEFTGKFNGSIGRGQIALSWESGATIVGRSPVGDFEIAGESKTDYSP